MVRVLGARMVFIRSESLQHTMRHVVAVLCPRDASGEDPGSLTRVWVRHADHGSSPFPRTNCQSLLIGGVSSPFSTPSLLPGSSSLSQPLPSLGFLRLLVFIFFSD